MTLDTVASAIVADGWTIATLAAHTAEMRAADLRFAEEREARRQEVAAERDRRYAEVNVEKEKALKIKETADLAALTLAREIQSYKDQATEKSREQSLRETGAYVTHEDLTRLEGKLVKIIEPLVDYVSSQRGVVTGSSLTTGRLTAIIGGGAAIMGIVFGIVAVFAK